MHPPERADGTLIAAEAARYLAAVEAFRREGHEPHWDAEGEPQLGMTSAVSVRASGGGVSQQKEKTMLTLPDERQEPRSTSF